MAKEKTEGKAKAKAAREDSVKAAGAKADSGNLASGNKSDTLSRPEGAPADNFPAGADPLDLDSVKAGPDSIVARPDADAKTPADSGGLRKDPFSGRNILSAETVLVVLPMVAGNGVSASGEELRKADAALRMGLNQAGRFRVLTEEEALRFIPGGQLMPKNCFSGRCVEAEAGKLRRGLLVVSQYSRRDSVTRLKLVMAETPRGKIHWAMQVWGKPGPGGIIPFAREAAWRFARPEQVRPQSSGHVEARIDGTFFTTRPWGEVPWLNPIDSVDNRKQWGWIGSGLLLAGGGLAYAQGHLTWADDNHARLARETLSGGGAQSFLRGFFAAPTLGARYAAMGGAGIAHVNQGLALLMNPAGLAGAEEENVIAAKRSLPDGTPSLFLGLSGPLYGHWAQGLGIQFEGDRLANETTLHGALGYDLIGLGKDFADIRIGAQPKIYLAQVGETGTGEDRSTGRSFGLGLDLGIQARLNERISAAIAVRDALSFLEHTNTLTDRSYAEVLPTEYRVGAAYRASPTLLLLLDGQKAMWADQADHLRLGGEQVLFDFLALRCGLHEILGRESVRKMSLGFGLDTRALGDKGAKFRLAVNYAYEFGLGEDETLGAGQQFSLDAGF
ncbi:MAG: hypothetical protein ABI036_18180 [Fibrobacteria bacterium]